MDGDSEIIVDEQGRLMRRVRRVRQPHDNTDGVVQTRAAELEDIQRARILASSSSSDSRSGRRKTLQEEAGIMRALQAETEALEKENARRECPVPKPKGALGRFLGFNGEEKKESAGSS